MTEKGCDNCYYSYFDERAYPCSLCIRGIERTDLWQPSKKTKADRKTESDSEIPNNSTISKMEQVDKDINVRSKDEPKICDTCRYYNSYMPCGSTPDACKKADKFAEEFVDGLKKLKPKIEPQTCDTCKWGEWYRKGYDITMMSDECGGCCSWNNKWKPKDEPQKKGE